MTDEKERKVIDLNLRRKVDTEDPAMILAHKLTKILSESASDTIPEDQLIALELATRALLETLRHAKGELFVNNVLVEFDHKRKQYHLHWPENDESPTVYDHIQEPEKAEVVSIRKDRDHEDEAD